MASFNKVFLMGNLTRDPQLKYLPNQTAVVDFGIACNRRWKGPNGEDRDEVTFVDVSSFGKQAEVINQYFQKGKPIFIEGRIKYDQWEDKQGGGKRSKLSVVIENFQFIGAPQGAGGGGQGGGNYEGGSEDQAPPPQQNRGPARPPQSRPPQQRPQQSEPPFSEEQQFKDDDIPF